MVYIYYIAVLKYNKKRGNKMKILIVSLAVFLIAACSGFNNPISSESDNLQTINQSGGSENGSGGSENG